MKDTEFRIQFSNRLNKALDKIGAPQKGSGRQNFLAHLINVSQVSARNWLEGQGTPRIVKTIELANKLHTTSSWLMFGEDSEVPSKLRSIPILGKVSAGNLMEMIASDKADCKSIYIDGSISENCFALIVDGDSMTNPNARKSFPKGSIIILDPNKQPESEDYIVVCNTIDNSSTFKKLAEDSGKKYLIPLNKSYPTILLDENYICLGVVIQHVYNDSDF